VEPLNDAAPIARPSPSAPAAALPSLGRPEPEAATGAASAALNTAPLLVERGDRLFDVRDIASARLFYERAAETGDAQAALRLGETYDPAFLERAHLLVPGDRTQALFWYARARELGAGEAEILLEGVESR
jgi:TPR repeat protein